ncbi:hypothetical protein EVAR_21146_1 [Eumeta japonica]|uniref:Uncharacterized protein n=1 Tax=Eumeta variegata TaxID=151549 RepID=A0A4C1VTU9_EUMVA|nr:hypothetical protein EVAR_21146_1 [Eumeta japonica]
MPSFHSRICGEYCRDARGCNFPNVSSEPYRQHQANSNTSVLRWTHEVSKWYCHIFLGERGLGLTYENLITTPIKYGIPTTLALGRGTFLI